MNDLLSLFRGPAPIGGAARRRQPLQEGPRLPPEVLLRTRQSVPLSFSQEQLCFLDQLELGNASYHTRAAARVRGALDTVAWEQALRAAVSRHEVLRTTYPARDGRPVQVVAPASALDVRFTDLGALPESEREARARG